MDSNEIVFVVLWILSTVVTFFAIIKWAIDEKVKNPDADIIGHCMAALCSPIIGPLVVFSGVVLIVFEIPIVILNFSIKKLASRLRSRKDKGD